MTEQQRRYMHARNDFEAFHVKKAQELIDATTALVADANRRVEETEKVMEQLRPFWAQGFTSDSVAAQTAGNALTQLWQILGVDNQTDAVARLSDWAKRFIP